LVDDRLRPLVGLYAIALTNNYVPLTETLVLLCAESECSFVSAQGVEMPDHSPKRVDLALQGGGAHGAFTWGVLDRLLEEERLEIEAISGTSAGAMNACAVADGLAQGGREDAREKLKRF
jgi:Patatin-like phospholipase